MAVSCNFSKERDMNIQRSTRNFVFVAIFALLFFLGSSDAAAGTIFVDASSNIEACDGVVTFREAVDIVQGNLLVITNAEYNQITDGSGMGIVPWGGPPPSGCPIGVYWWVVTARNSFDHIKFSSGITNINLTSPLPDFRFGGEEIDGRNFDGVNITLDGASAGANANGIWVGDSHFNILNMQICNFSGDGVRCDSCDATVFRGLNINHNGGHGIHLLTTYSAYGNPQNDTIGGTGSDQGNLIFRNGGDGINITADLNFDRTNETIQILNNLIGPHDG